MGLVIVILLIALLFGVLGAVVEGLLWLLFIGVLLLLAGAVLGFTKRGARRT